MNRPTARKTRTNSRPAKRRTPKPFRFDARLNEDQKFLLQRAADFEGRTMTDFVIHSAEQAATRTLRERSTLILNAKATEAFVAALLNPPAPTPVLRAAAQRYKKFVGE